jgi:hypothetical protein
MDTRKLTDKEFAAHWEARMAKAEAEMQWGLFRDAVKPLCCREKLRPKHWQRALTEYFEVERSVAGLPEDPALIERTVDEMMQASRPWCNPQVFDEVGARAALQCALSQILVAQDSTPLDDAVQVSQSVDIAARTAELMREVLQ